MRVESATRRIKARVLLSKSIPNRLKSRALGRGVRRLCRSDPAGNGYLSSLILRLLCLLLIYANSLNIIYFSCTLMYPFLWRFKSCSIKKGILFLWPNFYFDAVRKKDWAQIVGVKERQCPPMGEGRAHLNHILLHEN